MACTEDAPVLLEGDIGNPEHHCRPEPTGWLQCCYVRGGRVGYCAIPDEKALFVYGRVEDGSCWWKATRRLGVGDYRESRWASLQGAMELDGDPHCYKSPHELCEYPTWTGVEMCSGVQ